MYKTLCVRYIIRYYQSITRESAQHPVILTISSMSNDRNDIIEILLKVALTTLNYKPYILWGSSSGSWIITTYAIGVYHH
jgi:hypothetical protein